MYLSKIYKHMVIWRIGVVAKVSALQWFGNGAKKEKIHTFLTFPKIFCFPYIDSPCLIWALNKFIMKNDSNVVQQLVFKLIDEPGLAMALNFHLIHLQKRKRKTLESKKVGKLYHQQASFKLTSFQSQLNYRFLLELVLNNFQPTSTCINGHNIIQKPSVKIAETAQI